MLPTPRVCCPRRSRHRARRETSAPVLQQLDFWRRRLGANPPVLALPTDKPRPALLTYRGSMEAFSLSETLTARLKTASREGGATLYMLLQAAFSALLSRYTGQEDIIIGGVTDTRRRPELQNVMGYFLNSFALRTRADASLSFRAYLQEVGTALLEALDATDVPFDRVVQECQSRRDLARHPIFQVLFSVEPPVEPFSDGWDLTQMDVKVASAKFDLYLEIDERPEGLIGRVMYNADLFEAETIIRLIAHWRSVLEAVCTDLDCTLGNLPLLNPTETKRLLVIWNDTAQAVPTAALDELVEAQARRTPNAGAVVSDGRAYSYAELTRRAEEIAVHLKKTGLARRGALVGICMERGFDMVAAMLAILKTGAAYLPLDPAFPPARLAMIAEDAGPAVMLAQSWLRPIVPAHGATILYCDEMRQEGEWAPQTVGTERRLDDLAYVLYTSGSTGRPKGVEVPHGAIVNLLTSVQREPGFGAEDTLLAVTTLSFDIAALEIFLPLISGGRVIVADRATATDPTLLADLIAASECTVMQATPATWRGLLDAGWSGASGLKILCGGEALPRSLADRLLSRCNSLWNMYGPTETTVWSTLHKVDSAEGVIPIGRPIANTQIYILDASGCPVPIGVQGEIHIGGAGLARGYRNREKATQERFVNLPVAEGIRLYRTGDMARYRADGIIECLGRSDNQVKVRGFRIELEEIEAALEKHPAIAAAAVKPWPDSSGEASLTAYLVPRRGSAPSMAELRPFLASFMPDYMIPSRSVSVSGLPLTPNRKIDRDALLRPEQEEASEGLSVEVTPPVGEIQVKLAAIWKEVLRIPNVGVDQNFFDLGGHSLMVARLIRAVEAEFRHRLFMSSVFQAPTIRGMSALLDGSAGAIPVARTINIQPQGWRPILFWCDAGPIFRAAAAAIGLDQPFLGVTLDPTELEQLAQPARLEDIAACIVRTIRATQANGPYYIGGWCKWGILAYAVARQFIMEEQDVGLLIILEAPNPNHYRKISAIKMELSKLRQHGAEILRRRGRQQAAYALRRSRGALSRYRKWILTSGVSEEPAFDGVLRDAVQRYDPPSYAGDVALLVPIERPGVVEYKASWSSVVTGRMAEYEVPGDHLTMLQPPHAEALGKQIRACLVEVQERSLPPRKVAG